MHQLRRANIVTARILYCTIRGLFHLLRRKTRLTQLPQTWFRIALEELDGLSGRLFKFGNKFFKLRYVGFFTAFNPSTFFANLKTSSLGISIAVFVTGAPSSEIFIPIFGYFASNTRKSPPSFERSFAISCGCLLTIEKHCAYILSGSFPQLQLFSQEKLLSLLARQDRIF